MIQLFPNTAVTCGTNLMFRKYFVQIANKLWFVTYILKIETYILCAFSPVSVLSILMLYCVEV